MVDWEGRQDMATGLGNKLVGQTGEYLVAAKLSRMGFITTTFTGNVPHYDIIASDDKGRHVAVQVKTSRGDSWQVGDISHFCDIQFTGKRQVVGRKTSNPIRKLVCVFVRLDDDRGDRFFICTWRQWRDLLVKHHTAYLKKHHGQRPKEWRSLHCGTDVRQLARFEGKWQTVRKNLH